MDPHYKPFVGISFDSIDPDTHPNAHQVIVSTLQMEGPYIEVSLEIYQCVDGVNRASLLYRHHDGFATRMVGPTQVDTEQLTTFCIKKFKVYNVAYQCPVVDVLNNSFLHGSINPKVVMECVELHQQELSR